MKTAIIIQTRMGSTRLPGKSMMDVSGKPLIWHVIERAIHSEKSDEVILATTKERQDDQLAAFAKEHGIQCFRGDLDDVLDRYYRAAKECNADVVVRITGDCPLVDPHLIDLAVSTLKKGKYDYVSNCQDPWMDGFDVEAFTFAALEDAWKNAEMASEREHVTPYIKNNKNFKKHYLKNDIRLEKVHCSVDRENDLEFVRKIYGMLLSEGKDHAFGYLDVISLLEKKPELLSINNSSVVNEGYAKSLREDKKVK